MASWHAVRMLGAGVDQHAYEPIDPVHRSSQEHGPGELARGLLLLLDGLLGTITPNRRDDDGEDRGACTLKTFVTKLRTVFADELDPDVLPMLTGALTAALTGRGALHWRERARAEVESGRV